jgi:peroxiredoxin
MVTICADKPKAIAQGMGKHGAKAVMLSDSKLAVTRSYGICNEKAVGPKMVQALPIPTTFLVDSAGVVRWIDQAGDYQIRSDPDRVMTAIEQNL